MNKNLNIVVKDEDILELMRILMDDDAEGALAYLKIYGSNALREWRKYEPKPNCEIIRSHTK